MKLGLLWSTKLSNYCFKRCKTVLQKKVREKRKRNVGLWLTAVVLYRFLSACIMKIFPKASDPQLVLSPEWDYLAYVLHAVLQSRAPNIVTTLNSILLVHNRTIPCYNR